MAYSVVSVSSVQQPHALSAVGWSVNATALPTPALRPIYRRSQAMPGLGIPESGPYLPVPSSMVRHTPAPATWLDVYRASPVKASTMPVCPAVALVPSGQKIAPLATFIMSVSAHLSSADGLLRYTEPPRPMLSSAM